MTLQELITSVKERNLTKDQLEAYRDDLSGLFAQMQLEMAELEKKQAVFLEYEQNAIDKPSVAKSEINWKATQDGQRLIVLKRYALAAKEMLNSLKSRLYEHY